MISVTAQLANLELNTKEIPLAVQTEFLEAARDRDLSKLDRMIGQYGKSIVKTYGKVAQNNSYMNFVSEGNPLVQAITGRVFEPSLGLDKLTKVVRLLILNGCDVDKKSSTKLSPLHLAFKRNDQIGLDIASELLLANAEPLTLDRDAKLPIDAVTDKRLCLQGHTICEIRHPHYIDEAKPLQKLKIEKMERTQKALRLLGAVTENKVEDCKRLLEAGSDPNSQIKKLPLLYYAATFGKAEIVKLLIQSGASVPNKVIVNGEEVSLLTCTFFSPDVEIVRYLLDKGMNPNESIESKDPTQCGYVWHSHALMGNKQIVQVFLEKGANKKARSPEGWTLAEYLQPKLYPKWNDFRQKYYNTLIQNSKEKLIGNIPVSNLLEKKGFIFLLAKYDEKKDADGISGLTKKYEKFLQENPEWLDLLYGRQTLQGLVKALKIVEKAEKQARSIISGDAPEIQQLLKMIA